LKFSFFFFFFNRENERVIVRRFIRIACSNFSLMGH